MKRALALAVTLSLAVVAGGGCGPGSSRAEVKGIVVMAGQPLKILEEETVHITFALVKGESAGDEELAGAGEVGSDGSFVVKFPPGKALVAGKYRVALSSEVYGEEYSEKKQPRFAAFDADDSPLIADLTADDGQTFLIDLKKKSVAKQ
jgi:hypothetical protein